MLKTKNKLIKTLKILLIIYGIVCVTLGGASITLIAMRLMIFLTENKEFTFPESGSDLLFILLIPGIIYLTSHGKLNEYKKTDSDLLMKVSIIAILACVVFAFSRFYLLDTQPFRGSFLHNSSNFRSALSATMIVFQALPLCAIPVTIIIILNKIKNTK